MVKQVQNSCYSQTVSSISIIGTNWPFQNKHCGRAEGVLGSQYSVKDWPEHMALVCFPCHGRPLPAMGRLTLGLNTQNYIPKIQKFSNMQFLKPFKAPIYS